MSEPSASSLFRDVYPEETPAAVRTQETGIKIGIWGTQSAGKSTLLAMTYRLADSIAARFQLLAASGQPAQISRATTNFLLEADEALQKGEFPPKTLEQRHLVFEVRRQGARRGNDDTLGLLITDDWPGERFGEAFWEAREKAVQGSSASRGPDMGIPEDMERALAELAGCQGIVCLLDLERLVKAAERQARGYYAELLLLFSALKEKASESDKGFVKQHIAVCLSKADICWDYYLLNHYTPDQIYNELVDAQTKTLIGNHVHPSRLRFFVCSAVGTYRDEHNRPRPNVKNIAAGGGTKPCIPRPQAIKPDGIFEPFEWLFDQIGQGQITEGKTVRA